MAKYCHVFLAVLVLTTFQSDPVPAQDETLRVHHSELQNLQRRVDRMHDRFAQDRNRIAWLAGQTTQIKSDRAETGSVLVTVESRLKLLREVSEIVDEVEIDGQKMSFRQRADEWERLSRDQARLSEIVNDLRDKLEQVAIELNRFEREKPGLFEEMTDARAHFEHLVDQVATFEDSATKTALRQLIVKIENRMTELQEDLEAGLAGAPEWIPIFNGQDLDGWTPKIRGYETGENFGNTFRVEDGLLKVAYDEYDDGFQRRFGHLFYKDSLSHYRLRIEYRFTGEQVEGGPGWALSNSGVMLHGQDPESMELDQDFPVSIEVQLLADDGTGERPTANVCSPGTHYELEGQLVTQHCRDSTSATYPLDQWVTVEIEVRGDQVIRHMIDGDVVLEYRRPQFDPGDAHAQKLIVDGNVRLTGGTISLQSESHPVEFRKVELLKLDDAEEDE